MAGDWWLVADGWWLVVGDGGRWLVAFAVDEQIKKKEGGLEAGK